MVNVDVHSFPQLPFLNDLLSFRAFKAVFMGSWERFTFVWKHNGTQQSAWDNIADENIFAVRAVSSHQDSTHSISSIIQEFYDFLS